MAKTEFNPVLRKILGETQGGTPLDSIARGNYRPRQNNNGLGALLGVAGVACGIFLLGMMFAGSGSGDNRSRGSNSSYSRSRTTYSSNVSNTSSPYGGSSSYGGSYAWPVSGSRNISSGYGYRTMFGSRHFHKGIDISASSGTPVMAICSGNVIDSGWRSSSCGNGVKLKQDDGNNSTYCHMSSVAVKDGQRVLKGELIGYVGSTGKSTGPHLHLAIDSNGSYVDPQRYF